MTYTEHKLTDHQLQRLSAIINGRRHHHGMALEALIRKELIIDTKTILFSYDLKYEATEQGAQALQDARREGW